ncbi:MAG: hypothetical protein PUF72_10365 [Clostridiales bacterium]|nr:hypothetical protein [Clostridiales bacterium]
MKKIISVFLSLALLCAGGAALSADTVVASPPQLKAVGEEFVDIAYGNGTYVAMTKSNLNNLETGDKYAYPRLYYSKDNGITWTKNSSGQPELYKNVIISTNPITQQQLVWWEAKKQFLVHGTAGTYVSDNGVTWTLSPATSKGGLTWSSAAILAISGNRLVMGANQKAMAPDTTAQQGTKDYAITTNTAYYVKAISAKPADANGIIDVFVSFLNMAYDLQFDTKNNTWSSKKPNSGPALPKNVYDIVYAESADQFLSVDTENGLIAFKDSQNFSKIKVSDATVTGIGANDKYIVAGMSDGTMYYTQNAALDSNTEWTQIKPLAGAKSAAEPIKNIEFSDDNNFIALGTTQVYKATLEGYCNITEYGKLPSVSKPELSEATITSDDGFWARTASFELTPNGKAVLGVKVKVNDMEQTKEIPKDVSSTSNIKFGIIVISDSQDKVGNAVVSAQVITEE